MSRKPDVVELLTDDQLSEAVAEWLHERKRIPDGQYERSSLTVGTDGRHTFQAWKSDE